MKEQMTMEGLAARRIALKVIRQVTENDAYASLALDAALKNCGLSGADRRLVSRLAYDTLDHLIYLDWALARVMARPDTDIKLKTSCGWAPARSCWRTGSRTARRPICACSCAWSWECPG